MIKVKWIGIALLCCMFPACFAELLVQQDFEGTTFPPVGWTTSSGGHGFWSGSWTRITEGDNHFAQGNCAAQSSSSGGRILLFTPNFYLTTGSVLTISFNGLWYADPYGTGVNFALANSQIVVWTGVLPEDGQFKERTYTTSPVPANGNYHMVWMCYCDNYMTAWGLIQIDNVVISTVQKSTNSTESLSLGRIKSAYK
jgi:hypothetical protein